MLISGLPQRDHEVEHEHDPDRCGEVVDAAMAGDHEGRAEDPEHRARGADGERIGAEQERAERAGEQRGEVEGDEARRADSRLEDAAEEEEGEHVEADVEQAGVEERAGQQAVPLAFGDERPEQAEVEGDRAGAGAEAPAAAGDLGQVRGDVERDQDVGGGRVVVAGSDGAARHPGPLSGALGAAHAYRGRGHAVGADRPAAVGAGDAGLPARMPVASRHRGSAAYLRRTASQ